MSNPGTSAERLQRRPVNCQYGSQSIDARGLPTRLACSHKAYSSRGSDGSSSVHRNHSRHDNDTADLVTETAAGTEAHRTAVRQSSCSLHRSQQQRRWPSRASVPAITHAQDPPSQTARGHFNRALARNSCPHRAQDPHTLSRASHSPELHRTRHSPVLTQSTGNYADNT